MSTPRLSVLLPIGRKDRFLREALSCLAAQTCRDFDVHIIGPPELQNYVAEEMRIANITVVWKYHCARLPNLAFALNLGFERSSGEFVARMDSDDLFTEARFEAQIGYLLRNSRCVVVGLKTVLIDENGVKISGHRFPFLPQDKQIRRALRIRNPICHPSVMFRRTALEKVGGYRYGNTAEDHELFLRLARDPNIEFANLAEPEFAYRRYSGQLTDKNRAHQAFCDIAGFMLTEFLRSKHPSLLLGMYRYHPWVRSLGARINSRRRAQAARSGA